MDRSTEWEARVTKRTGRAPILLLLFAMPLVACGSDLGGDLQPLVVHPFSLTPGCFTSPPIVEVPVGVSDLVVYESQRKLARDWDQSRVCGERYRAITDAISAAPGAEEWIVRPHEGNPVEVRVYSGEGDRGPNLAQFAISIVDPTADADTQDPCSKNRGGRELAIGETGERFSVIQHDYLYARWNNDASAITLPGPGGEFVMLLRGCDPSNKISFGTTVSYDSGSPVRCWTESGQFVSCEGVATWPFDDNHYTR